jgi:DNA-binding winged helix-turn-helix (wHTH) protein
MTSSQSIRKVPVRLRRIISESGRASKYVHAVPPQGYYFGKAICGAAPSRNSAWSNEEEPATDCPNCKTCIGVQRIGDDFVYVLPESPK